MEWFAGLGCDVQVLGHYMRTAADYAMIRVQEARDEMTGPGRTRRR